jgi:hypothetical protein
VRDMEAEIAGLRAVCPEAEPMSEGGIVFAFLPRLRFRAKGANMCMDALLCPNAHSGYHSRLFFDQVVPGYAGAWSGHQILARSWQTISWQGVSPDQPWTRILSEHLGAFA